jgi:hypothetical protein
VILISALASTFIENVSFAADLSVDCLGDYLPPGHFLDLPGYLPRLLLHRTACTLSGGHL